MIDFVHGTVISTQEKQITLQVGSFGLSLPTPDSSSFVVGKETKLFTYMHWNQEKGPQIFAFKSELDRTVFCTIIECPKIGPSIALSILSQMKASQFVEAVTSQNDKMLSAVNGIGTKKAENIISNLKHKVSKLLSDGKLVAGEQQDFGHWQSVSDALTSLNYSRHEINNAMQHLTKKYAGKNASLDQLIRSGLAFLSQKA